MITKTMINKLKEKDFIDKFKPDYWITINPKFINSNDNLILNTYKNSIIKYYKNQLGNDFNKKKELQMEQEYCLEYGKLAEYGIRQPHLHILIKSNKHNDIDKFIDFLYRQFRKITKNMSIEMSKLDSLKDTVIKGNYIEKEGSRVMPSKIFTHFTLQQGINY